EDDTYTIRVANAGPSAVSGTAVTDTFPTVLSAVTWTCSPAPGSSCGTATGSGDIATTVDLPAGGFVTFVAPRTVHPTATGTLVNSASAAPPADTPDPVPGNDSDSDTTSIAASADLVVTKSGPPRATAGSNLTFTTVVTNLGPSTASNVIVTDQ